MVSIQKNISISSLIKYSSFDNTNKAIHKKNVSIYSVKNEIVQFNSQVKTDTRQNLTDQNIIFHFDRLNNDDKASMLYRNKPISELSQEKAHDLGGDNGYYGIDKTSQRISDFVIKGAGNNIDRLKAGREGVLRGFNSAEKAWGGKLPDISYETMKKSLEVIDEKIREFGGSVVDFSA